MFSGIITDVGRVRAVEKRGDTRFEIATAFDMATVDIGASIACSGVSLTVVEKGPDWFAVEVSAETLARTNLGRWQKDTPVNLERALRVGDELGGHIVLGHVDGVGTISAMVPEGDSVRFRFEAPQTLTPFIASKGAVAVDGVSLTVNEVEKFSFGVNVLRHTREMTSLVESEVGDAVNLEVDVLARYVARLQDVQAA